MVLLRRRLGRRAPHAFLLRASLLALIGVLAFDGGAFAADPSAPPEPSPSVSPTATPAAQPTPTSDPAATEPATPQTRSTPAVSPELTFSASETQTIDIAAGAAWPFSWRAPWRSPPTFHPIAAGARTGISFSV